MNSKKDYEIEDLFPNETLEHKIDGKSFSRDKITIKPHIMEKINFHNTSIIITKLIL